MQTSLRLCIAQMTSTNRHAGNVAFLKDAARYAADQACQMLALPEVAGLMNKDREDALALIGAEADDPYINACQAQARKAGIWVHSGSTPVIGDDGRFLNHTNLFDDLGRLRAVYDKIHLFDAYLDGRPDIVESSRYAPGSDAVAVDTPWGMCGLSICYDLRFPQLYRDYAKSGAVILFIPSAFTVPTGAAHWEVLLRARAIETGCFVIAAAQVGLHDDGRNTWGHSMVIDPWGTVLADLGGEKAGLGVVELDLTQVGRARAQIPSLANERPYRMRHETAPLT